MKCELARDNLYDYLEDRVDPAMKVVLTHHFHECAPCREELEGAREMVGMFRALPMVDPPVNFRARILEQIERQPNRRARWRGVHAPVWRAPATGMAAAVLAIGLLFTRNAFHNGSIVMGPSDATVRETGILPLPDQAGMTIEGLPDSDNPADSRMAMKVTISPKSTLSEGRLLIADTSDGLVCETRSTASDRGRVLWQGSLAAGVPKSFIVRVRATRPGLHHLLLYVDGDWQDKRMVFIPVDPDQSTSPLSVLRGNWSTSDLLQLLAGRFGVVIATDLTNQRPRFTELQLTDPKSAIRQVAEGRQMQYREMGGIYNVYDIGPGVTRP